MSTVDPKVYRLAELFVDDLMRHCPGMAEVRAKLTLLRDDVLYDALVDRAAKAMQQAIEEELDAIREELLEAADA